MAPYTETSPRKYCTMKCLRHLMNEQRMDFKCPNLEAHRSSDPETTIHSLKPVQFLNLIQETLTSSFEPYLTPLNLAGDVGALFRVELPISGYTFVAKGVPAWFQSDLKNELSAYERMHTLQGRLIPVCMGYLHLRNAYYHYTRHTIHDWLFMSYSGIALLQDNHHSLRHKHNIALCNAARAMSRLGVKLNRGYDFPATVHWRNILWSEETQEIVVIDFEKAIVKERYRGGKRGVSSMEVEFDSDDFEERVEPRESEMDLGKKCEELRRELGLLEDGKVKGKGKDVETATEAAKLKSNDKAKEQSASPAKREAGTEDNADDSDTPKSKKTKLTSLGMTI